VDGLCQGVDVGTFVAGDEAGSCQDRVDREECRLAMVMEETSGEADPAVRVWVMVMKWQRKK
jgi:hypothetical protein